MSESGPQTPAKLQQLYHAAPRLKSPDQVDQQVMLAAKSAAGTSSAVDSVRVKKRPPRIGMSLPALAAMCVIGVGVGVLYQSDKKTPGERVAETVQSIPAAESGISAMTQADAEPVLTQQTIVDESISSIQTESDSDASGLQVEGVAGTESLSEQVLLAPIALESGEEDLQVADSVTASAESASIESVVEQRKLVADTMARSSAVNKIDAVTAGSDRKVSDLPGNVWLHRQSSSSFTLRLTTANTIASLEKFAATVNLPAEKILLKSGQWILVYGSFNTLSEVQQELGSLQQSGVVSSSQSNAAIVVIGELQSLSE